MCDSAVILSALTQSETPRCLTSSLIFGNSETCVNISDEFQSDEASLEVSNITDGAGSSGCCKIHTDSFPYRVQLQQDVKRLQQQLQEEIEMHALLETAIEKALGVSCPSFLPDHVQELLSTVSVLEVTVSKLEQEIISLHFQLSQERNERRLAEYRLRHSASQSTISSCDNANELMSPLSFQQHSDSQLHCANEEASIPAKCPGHSDSLLHRLSEEVSLRNQAAESSQKPMDQDTSELTCFQDKNLSANGDGKPSCQSDPSKKIHKGMRPKGLWDNPNHLSEEMVKCMKNIFMTLVDSSMPSKSTALERGTPPVSPQGHLSSSSWWSSSDRLMNSVWTQSPQVDIRSNSEILAKEGAFDPYRVHGKLSWADIGNYGFASEVSWMSVGKKQLEYASGALRKFRILVEELAKVNPVHLSSNEKLAFWINLYNALIMHAYLAYGVPRSDLKLFSLMQKAAYTVGGHSFSAAAIEYMILKMKPPIHRPQIALLLALHKLKVSDEQRKSAIDAYEPLVSFALSCGMYSSPAVRIYTAKNVKEELQEAQHDFIRASVGVSNKGKLLVPKLLHCFAKAYVDDSNLAVWISRYLPPNQAAFVEDCISQRRQRILSSRNCGILSFDSRFRYLFLPDKLPYS